MLSTEREPDFNRAKINTSLMVEDGTVESWVSKRTGEVVEAEPACKGSWSLRQI